MTRNNGQNDKEISIFSENLGALKEFESELKESLSTAIGKYIRQSPSRSRKQMAGKISHLLDRNISDNMLSAYCSPGKNDDHPHADLVVAICKITGSKKPLEVMGRYLKYSILDDNQMIYVELSRTTREIKKLEQKKRDLENQIEVKNG